MTLKPVKDYMTQKAALIAFQPDTDIYVVIKTLIKQSISGAPVIDAQGELVGIISEKDCLKVLLEMAMHELPGGHVDKYMSKQVTALEQNRSIFDAVEMFQKTNFRRFPVVDGKKLVGIISRRDMLRAIEEIRSQSLQS
jgi:CBS domain-containing protein